MFDGFNLEFKLETNHFLTATVENPEPWLEEQRGETEPFEQYLEKIESQSNTAELPGYNEILCAAIDEIPAILGKRYSEKEYTRPVDENTSSLESAENAREKLWQKNINPDDFRGRFFHDTEVVYGFIPRSSHSIGSYEFD